jgi:hypothetical protein
LIGSDEFSSAFDLINQELKDNSDYLNNLKIQIATKACLKYSKQNDMENSKKWYLVAFSLYEKNLSTVSPTNIQNLFLASMNLSHEDDCISILKENQDALIKDLEFKLRQCELSRSKYGFRLSKAGLESYIKFLTSKTSTQDLNALLNTLQALKSRFNKVKY